MRYYCLDEKFFVVRRTCSAPKVFHIPTYSGAPKVGALDAESITLTKLVRFCYHFKEVSDYWKTFTLFTSLERLYLVRLSTNLLRGIVYLPYLIWFILPEFKWKVLWRTNTNDALTTGAPFPIFIQCTVDIFKQAYRIHKYT